MRKGIRVFRKLALMRLNIGMLLVLAFLMFLGTLTLRGALLRNAWNAGCALARNYAAEASSSLSVYESLLSFGAASVNQLTEEENPKEELSVWSESYFNRIQSILGETAVTPYLVFEGEFPGVDPLSFGEGYHIEDREWYRLAQAEKGQTVFTGLYTDAITGKDVITAALRCQADDTFLVFDIFPRPSQFESQSSGQERGYLFFLCDSQGNLLYATPNIHFSSEESQQYSSLLVSRAKAGELGHYSASATGPDGQQYGVYYAAMDNGWYCLISAPYSLIFEDMWKFVLVFSMILALFVLTSLWMAWRELRFNTRYERTNETVRVLGNSYYAIYRINVDQDTYEIIKGSEYVRGRLPKKGPYEDLLQVIGEIIEPSASEDFKRSFCRDHVRALVAQRVRDFGGEFLRLFQTEYRWVSVRVLFDESLAPGDVVLCFREVEQEKQAQLKEQKLLEDALNLTRRNEAAKQTFFSSMSHDMRTPLNAIIGLSGLAEQNAKDRNKVADYLQKILHSSQQLLGLINDILDMSRMEQGRLVLNKEPFNLRQCVEDCLAAFRIQAEQQKKNFSVRIDVQDETVLGDPFRIGQILNNLLSNAFKFTEAEGTISVSLSQLDRQDFPKYKIVVADTGTGMSQDFLNHIFEPYTRETRFAPRKIPGTGLGMPITRNLVTQMNGEIRVESQLGQGSTFTVVIPFGVVRDAPPAEGKNDCQDFSGILKGRRVLLAEDNQVNMEIAAELLEMSGVSVVQAWNGKEALRLFEASEPFFFDAVLMDMQMPEMDGCEAARRIRSLSRPDAERVPIIAVTANAFAEDISATAAAGMNAHISKPIDFGLLSRTLSQLIGRPSSENDGCR